MGNDCSEPVAKPSYEMTLVPEKGWVMKYSGHKESLTLVYNPATQTLLCEDFEYFRNRWGNQGWFIIQKVLDFNTVITDPPRHTILGQVVGLALRDFGYMKPLNWSYSNVLKYSP